MVNILASKRVAEGDEICLLHRAKDFWIALSKNDIDFQVDNGVDNLFVIEEDSIYQRVPYLKGKLNQPVNTTINIDVSTGEINLNPKHFHIGIPTHSAKSTRQVNASFSFARWLFINRKSYVKFLVIELILLLLALIVGWFFYIPFAVYFIFEGLSLLKERDMFKSGDLCPAIVLSESNMTIAVLSDLSCGVGKFPIIRVKKVNLPVKYRKEGTMIPIAGGYYNTGKYLHWNCFNPLPIPSGTKDESLIEEKKKMIPPLEWVKLKSEIKKLQNEPAEGYYPIDIERSSWKECKLFDIKWVNC